MMNVAYKDIEQGFSLGHGQACSALVLLDFYNKKDIKMSKI